MIYMVIPFFIGFSLGYWHMADFNFLKFSEKYITTFYFF